MADRGPVVRGDLPGVRLDQSRAAARLDHRQTLRHDVLPGSAAAAGQGLSRSQVQVRSLERAEAGVHDLADERMGEAQPVSVDVGEPGRDCTAKQRQYFGHGCVPDLGEQADVGLLAQHRGGGEDVMGLLVKACETSFKHLAYAGRGLQGRCSAGGVQAGQFLDEEGVSAGPRVHGLRGGGVVPAAEDVLDEAHRSHRGPAR